LSDLAQVQALERTFPPPRFDACHVQQAPDQVAHALQTVLAAVDQPVTLQADRNEMEMILHNLLSNAVKYNRPAGQVHVTLDQNGSTVSIAVADTGIGMAADDTRKLFGEFVRIRNDATREIPGSGLGLSIVAKIARLYRGEVVVDSEPGVGSKFSVVLQNSPATAPVAPALRQPA